MEVLECFTVDKAYGCLCVVVEQVASPVRETLRPGRRVFYNSPWLFGSSTVCRNRVTLNNFSFDVQDPVLV